jgi:hypothetical protein
MCELYNILRVNTTKILALSPFLPGRGEPERFFGGVFRSLAVRLDFECGVWYTFSG